MSVRTVSLSLSLSISLFLSLGAIGYSTYEMVRQFAVAFFENESKQFFPQKKNYFLEQMSEDVAP